MFILVLFGYKQFKVFTLDVLGQTLIDCIWAQAYKEMVKVQVIFYKLLTLKEEQHTKESKAAASKFSQNEKRIQAINLQLDQDPNKKDDKKAAKQPPPKKGKEVIPGNPLEAERMELQKENEKLQDAQVKYHDKLTKLNVTLEKYRELNEKYQSQQLVLELFDKTGERKFIKTKLDLYANEFLSDRGTYILGYIQPQQNPEDEELFFAAEYEGFIVRSVEEDIGAIEEPLLAPQVKKDDKKKKGKK